LRVVIYLPQNYFMGDGSKMKKTKIIISVFGIVIVLIILFSLFRTNKEVKMFEEEFGLSLPAETNIIFSESDYGAMGDGTRLYIYQIGSDDMKKLVRQNELNNWYKLPFNNKLSVELRERVDGLSNKKIANAIKFDLQKGYYIVKNRYNKPLKGYDFSDLSYNNIIIGVIDLEKDKIYLYTWDT
jgi:hypothetical protein